LTEVVITSPPPPPPEAEKRLNVKLVAVPPFPPPPTIARAYVPVKGAVNDVVPGEVNA
jgi:hypothetical protein